MKSKRILIITALSLEFNEVKQFLKNIKINKNKTVLKDKKVKFLIYNDCNNVC